MFKTVLRTAPIWLIWIASDGFAQSQTEMDAVTITATRSPQKISETGRSITVIEGSRFNNLPVQSVDELLRYVPGIEVQSRGPMGAQSDIVMRGGTFQQVLVLLDGVKINDPITGHFNGNLPIAPFEIQRIEVLRGPAASVYGAEAVGGVINIITHSFHKHETVKKTEGKTTLALGQYGLVMAEGGVRKTGPKWNLSAGALSNSTYGQKLRGDNRGFIYNHTFSASASLALKNNWQLSLRSSYDNRRFAAQNFYTTFLSDTARETVNKFWNQAQLKQVKDGRLRQADLMYKSTTDDFLFNSNSIPNNNRSNSFFFQYLESKRINNRLTLNGGVQLDRRAIRSNDRGNHATHRGSLFGGGLYSYKQWRFSPSLRVDWDENYKGALLPQFNVAYLMPKMTLRANAGRAIRGADFTERFNNFNKPIVTGGSIGNPNLGAENSWSYEAGFDYIPTNDLRITFSGFYRDQQDVIDFVPTPYEQMPRRDNLVPGRVYALAKNIKEVSTRGLEMDISYQHSFAEAHSLNFNAGITLLRSTTSDSVPSFYILSHANTLIQGNIVYNIKQFSVAVNGLYKKRNARQAPAINAEITPSYFVMNLRASYALYNGSMRFFLQTNNLFDEVYSDLLGSRMPRQWTSAGVTISFR
jgi:vitamin B12 transporter